MATTSVIIPLRQSRTSLDVVLEAVANNRSAAAGLEVIVVGPESSASPPPAGRDRFGLRWLPCGASGSFAAACNAGARAASGDSLVFLDPAMTAGAGWLDALLDHGAASPAAAIVGSKLIDGNNAVCHAGVVIGQDRHPRPLYAGFPADHPAVNQTRRFQAVNLEGALVRRDAFDLAGGFDADFFGGLEDVDLCLRMAELGYETHFCHRSVLYRASPFLRRWSGGSDGAAGLFRRRWAHRVSPDDLAYLIEDGLLTVSYRPNHEIRVAVAPILGPSRETGPVANDDGLVAIPSKSLLELMARAIGLAGRVQDAGWRGGDRVDEPAHRPALAAARFPALENPSANGNGEGNHVVVARPEGDAAGAVSEPAEAPPANDAGPRRPPKRTSYAQMIRDIRWVVHARLPQAATVIVVSKGDDRLLQLGTCRGLHFPQNAEGVYAGYHPADSREAIAHLEDLRRAGGQFLLFPSTAFWWLGYYRDFQKHLETKYSCICSERSCLIFQLTPTADGPDRGE